MSDAIAIPKESGLVKTPFPGGVGDLAAFLIGYGHFLSEFLVFLESDFPAEYFKDGQFSIHRTKGTDRANRDDFIKRLAMYLFDFRVHPEEHNIVFFKRHGEHTYQRCSSETLAKELNILWEKFFRCTPKKEVDDCVANILRNVSKKADVRNRVYRISSSLYFVPDEECSLVEAPPEGKECFYTLMGAYELFNGHEEYEKILKKTYDDFLSLLDSPQYKHLQFSNFYKELPLTFDWVDMWAAPNVAGYQDRYWDMMISFSTPFFKKLIEKVYLYDGKTRTGKSTAHDVLVFLFGVENVAQVMITDFANYHVNNALAYCCINTPDEEKGGVVPKDACPIFKTFAAKRGASLPVKNKQPVWGDGQFMSFSPTNSNLEWPDSESTPCLKRCLIIKFFNDLSRFDMNGKDFIEETFKKHPEEFAKFLGQVFALATYFSREDKAFFVSEEMKKANRFAAVETSSLDLYYDYFFKFFDAVSNEQFLWEDYQRACWAFGWTQQNEPAFRRQFEILLMQKSTPRKIPPNYNKTVRFIRQPKFSAPQVLYPGYELLIADEFSQSYSTPYGNAAQMHKDKLSVVATLYELERQREAEKEERELESKQEAFGGVLDG